jgi:hypothetical protein
VLVQPRVFFSFGLPIPVPVPVFYGPAYYPGNYYYGPYAMHITHDLLAPSILVPWTLVLQLRKCLGILLFVHSKLKL